RCGAGVSRKQGRRAPTHGREGLRPLAAGCSEYDSGRSRAESARRAAADELKGRPTREKARGSPGTVRPQWHPTGGAVRTALRSRTVRRLPEIRPVIRSRGQAGRRRAVRLRARTSPESRGRSALPIAAEPACFCANRAADRVREPAALRAEREPDVAVLDRRLFPTRLRRNESLPAYGRRSAWESRPQRPHVVAC